MNSLPKPKHFRRQQKQNGAYEMIEAYTEEEMLDAVEQARREAIEQCAQTAVVALWGDDRLACRVAAAIRARVEAT